MIVKSVNEQIKESALQALESNPEGLRFSELMKKISSQDERLNLKTLNTKICNLAFEFPNEIYKPDRGIYRLLKFQNEETANLVEDQSQIMVDESIALPIKIKEENFYKPFLNWLKNDVEDVTFGIELGGNIFQDKWGTPDVIGK